ncbi:MAG: TGS domain-containing protein, partial [Proteobacteria bacterium]|nr:TGS domain-containing protein [Pseudomonadota bacterium]MBU1708532.1 TGS domain-containing protein [Pseudomonadota bacterium]
LALTYKFPRQSHRLVSQLRQLEAKANSGEIIKKIRDELEKAWISSEVFIRTKGLWAYFDHTNRVLSKEIETPLEILIATNDIQTCYRILGIMNQSYPPIPRTIRDFIANPKSTGYQSLHVRINIKGTKYLCKIRTKNMLRTGRSGIIAEWASHGKVPSGFEKEIQEMFDILGTDDALSYRELIAASGKKEIYTYTPKGDPICLPINSNVLDFAFKIHTEVGRRCIHAKIGRNKVQPESILRDGDRVNIVCQEQPVRFDPGLQELCQTPRARTELSKMFRLRRENLAMRIGQSIFRQELKRYGIPHIMENEDISLVLNHYGLESIDGLFLEIGSGRLQLKELIDRIKTLLLKERKTLEPPTGILNRFDLDSLDPACIKLSRCCNPVPTEKGLIGLLSERGLSVHHNDCKKISSLKLQREDVVELRWKLKETRVRKPQSLLILKSIMRNRVLMLLSVAPAEMKIIDIISLSKHSASKSPWEINFTVDTLSGLKSILAHFNKTDILYEFAFEQ